MALQQVQEDEGPKLVAKGATVVLGGSPVKIRFDNRALVEIERRWGSIAAYGAELQKGEQGRMFTCIQDGLVAGVRGLPPGIEPEDLIDPARALEYIEAISTAFQEAMPEVPQDAKSVQVDGPLTGASSSTQPSSDSGWRPPTSGG